MVGLASNLLEALQETIAKINTLKWMMNWWWRDWVLMDWQ